jgi:hypothetical protein
MTAILVRFEWHDDVRSQKRARLLYRPLLAANHRSVQQGPCAPTQLRLGSTAVIASYHTKIIVAQLGAAFYL